MAGYRARGTLIAIGDGVVGAGTAISAVAVANNIATVTSTAHGLTTGDVVEIDGVVGSGTMAADINTFHLVTVVDTNDFRLDGSYVDGVYTSGGTVTSQNGGFATLGSVRDGNVEISADEIDVSAIDTPQGFREFDAGMKTGTWAQNLNYRPNLASHGAQTGLRRLMNASVERWWRYAYPQVSANPPYDASRQIMLTFNRTFDMEGRLELAIGGRTSNVDLSLPGS